MKRSSLVILIVLTLAIASTALAQASSRAPTPPGSGYDLSWNTIDGGGDVSMGDGYTLMGTIGQPDAGRLLNGGSYVLAGGFWAESGQILVASSHFVYLPVVIK